MQVDTFIDLQTVYVTDDPPTAWHERIGNLWWRPVEGQMHVWFNNVWTKVGSSTGFPTTVEDDLEGVAIVAKADPKLRDQMDGDLWYDYTNDILNISSAGRWIPVNFRVGP